MEIKNIFPVLQKMADYRRKEAELYFVLAMIHARSGQKHVARGYAEECIQLLKELGTETMEDCATAHTVEGRVALPEFLHEHVVRERLKHYGIVFGS